MSRNLGRIVGVSVWMLCVASASAQFFPQKDQKNEFAVMIGRVFTSSHAIVGTLPPPLTDNRVWFGKPLTFQGTYARFLKGSDLVSYTFEVPAETSLKRHLNSSNDNVPYDYWQLHVTPGIRVTLFPNTFVHPWASIGGGFSFFRTSTHGVYNVLTVPGHSNTTGTMQFGAGFDVKFWKQMRLRAELRDFYSGVPDFNVDQGRTRLHNITPMGGIVFPF